MKSLTFIASLLHITDCLLTKYEQNGPGDAILGKPNDGSDVTIMINAIEKDQPQMRVRLAHLLKYQNDKGTTRVLHVDTRPSNYTLSESFVACLTGLRRDGLIDSWLEVNYSKDYILEVQRKSKWKTNYISRGHQGNLVYWHMLDTCRTKYCVHWDLDMALWAKSGYSWIGDGKQLLESNSDALSVVPPKFGSIVFHNKVPGKAYSCHNPTFMSARGYLIDADRYRQLLKTAETTQCGGDVHWEEFMSCNSCQQKWKRIEMSDAESCKGMHFPMKASADVLDSILSRCWENGITIASVSWDKGRKSYSLYDGETNPTPWLSHACMKDGADLPVPVQHRFARGSCTAYIVDADDVSSCIQRGRRD